MRVQLCCAVLCCAVRVIYGMLTFDFPVPVAPTMTTKGSFGGFLLAMVVICRNGLNLVQERSITVTITITGSTALHHRILVMASAWS